VPLSGAGVYLGTGLHVRSVFTDGAAEKVQYSAFFLLPGREVMCSLLHMDNAITSAVTTETANAYADFIAMLCDPPARPALRVIEGGKSETTAAADEPNPYGAKYEKGLQVVEIAKRIRADIKAAIASGEIPAIKTSVRISRYSMGRSIDVTITEAPFAVINPEWVQARNEGVSVWELDNIDKFTAEASRVFDVVESIRAAYNYDRSDSMTDYYDVNFGGGVSFDWKLTN